MSNIPGIPSMRGGYLQQVAQNRQRDKERGSWFGDILKDSLTAGLGQGLGELGRSYAESLFSDDDLAFQQEESNKPNADIRIFTEADPDTISKEGLQRRLDELAASDIGSDIGTGRQALGEQKKGRFVIDTQAGVSDWSKRKDPTPEEIEGSGRMTAMGRALLAMQKKLGTEEGRREIHSKLYPLDSNSKRPPKGYRYKGPKSQHLHVKNRALTERTRQKEIREALTSEKGIAAHNKEVLAEIRTHNSRALQRGSRGQPKYDPEELTWALSSQYITHMFYERDENGKWRRKSLDNITYPDGTPLSKEDAAIVAGAVGRVPATQEMMGAYMRTGLQNKIVTKLPSHIRAKMLKDQENYGPDMVANIRITNKAAANKANLLKRAGVIQFGSGSGTYARRTGKTDSASFSQGIEFIPDEVLNEFVQAQRANEVVKGLVYKNKKWEEVDIELTEKDLKIIAEARTLWDRFEDHRKADNIEKANSVDGELKRLWKKETSRGTRNKLRQALNYKQKIEHRSSPKRGSGGKQNTLIEQAKRTPYKFFSSVVTDASIITPGKAGRNQKLFGGSLLIGSGSRKKKLNINDLAGLYKYDLGSKGFKKQKNYKSVRGKIQNARTGVKSKTVEDVAKRVAYLLWLGRQEEEPVNLALPEGISKVNEDFTGFSIIHKAILRNKGWNPGGSASPRTPQSPRAQGMQPKPPAVVQRLPAGAQELWYGLRARVDSGELDPAKAARIFRANA
tara:strand:- start:3234 stop:5438 length:2205 start_codon:yes stop_codon:yes gene_type:complete